MAPENGRKDGVLERLAKKSPHPVLILNVSEGLTHPITWYGKNGLPDEESKGLIKYSMAMMKGYARVSESGQRPRQVYLEHFGVGEKPKVLFIPPLKLDSKYKKAKT